MEFLLDLIQCGINYVWTILDWRWFSAAACVESDSGRVEAGSGGSDEAVRKQVRQQHLRGPQDRRTG